jgi:hypothetical protein
MRDIKLYGLQASGELESKFRAFGYEPQHSGIYRSLHKLIADSVLLRRKNPLKALNLKKWLYMK